MSRSETYLELIYIVSGVDMQAGIKVNLDMKVICYIGLYFNSLHDHDFQLHNIKNIEMYHTQSFSQPQPLIIQVQPS